MLTNNYYFIIICLSVVWKCPLSTSPYRYRNSCCCCCCCSGSERLSISLTVSLHDFRRYPHSRKYIEKRSHRYFFTLTCQLSSDRLPGIFFFTASPRVCLLCLTAICNTIHVLLLIILLLFFFFGRSLALKSSHATYFSDLKLTKTNTDTIGIGRIAGV